MTATVAQRASASPQPPPDHASIEHRGRRVSTPLILRLVMAIAWLPIALFALSVHVGVSRNDSAVKTVGRDATQGITAAQKIKLNLAELDEIVTEDLLRPLPVGPSGFPDDYNAKRNELDGTLVLAASKAPAGAAYQQPLANIHYALGHYHALLKDAFAFRVRGDKQQTSVLYGQAHDVMDQTLLPQADSFDKANTYVLNNTYDSHKKDAASTVGVIIASWIMLLVALGVGQFLLARKFHRLLNISLAAATLLAVGSGAVAIARVNSSSSNLTAAREHAFDAVHGLARARATVVAARQTEAQLLFDPSSARDSVSGFSANAMKLFRVRGNADAAAAQAGQVPPGAGGYLATVVNANASQNGNAAATTALTAFGRFVTEDTIMRASAASGNTPAAQNIFDAKQAFTALASALDNTQTIDQGTFDTHAGAAARATRNLDRLNVALAIAMLALVLAGIYQRLREYTE